METTEFLGLDCVVLSNDSLTLLVTRTVGPRILCLRYGNGENLFAEAPDLTLDCPGEGKFHFYGGHRLWHAPEIPGHTYIPDDQPIEVVQTDGGLRATQAIEEQTGIQKSMSVALPDNSPTVIVEHCLLNQGVRPVVTAPWAITQLKPQGIAILPQAIGNADVHGVQPNRSLVLWPYTDINSPNILWGNRFILVRAALNISPMKLGFPNPRGWIAYHQGDRLFVKYAVYDSKAAYFDLGASSQCYFGPDFTELETLGPQSRIRSGERAIHREVWRIFGEVSLSLSEEAVQELMDALGVER